MCHNNCDREIRCAVDICEINFVSLRDGISFHTGTCLVEIAIIKLEEEGSYNCVFEKTEKCQRGT